MVVISMPLFRKVKDFTLQQVLSLVGYVLFVPCMRTLLTTLSRIFFPALSSMSCTAQFTTRPGSGLLNTVRAKFY